jgi:preprotein translocase subunit SecY
MFSGGALSRFTVFALGIMPYISASIIMQLMTYVCRPLEAAQEGRRGRAPQDHAVHALRHAGAGVVPVVRHRRRAGGIAGPGDQPGLGLSHDGGVSLTAGTMFLMWLGEQITERGLGNGISILIFAGIAAGLPSAIGACFELVRTGAMSIIACLFIVALVVAGDLFVVFVERGSARSWSTTPSARSATRSTADSRRTCR